MTSLLQWAANKVSHLNANLPRLWLLALACVVCGVISRVVFAVSAPPSDRAAGWLQCEIQVLCYGAALLLFLAHLWRIGTSGRPPEQVPGCATALLLVVGAVLTFLVLAWSALPSE